MAVTTLAGVRPIAPRSGYRVLRLPAELVEKQLGEALARVRAALGAA